MSYLDHPERPSDPEQARMMETGKSFAELESEDEAIEREKEELCEQTIDDAIGYMNGKRFIKGKRGACRKYAPIPTDDMCDAVEDGDAELLLELFRREIVNNIRYDILGE